MDNYSEEAFGNVQLRSKLTMMALQSGIIESKACNSAGDCVREQKNFYVTSTYIKICGVLPNSTFIFII